MDILPNTDDSDNYLFPRSAKIFSYIMKMHIKLAKTGMDEIRDSEAAKLIRFATKTWKSLREKGKEFFKFPVIDVGAKHGTRVAYSFGSKDSPFFVLEGIKALSSCGTKKSKLIDIRYEKRKYATMQYIKPHINAIDITSMIEKKQISNDEFNMLNNLCEIISNLNEREIIALGRHENAENTMDSIKYEIDEWIKKNEKLVNLISEQNFCEDDKKVKEASNLTFFAWSFADEMKKKSNDDYKYYKSALEKIIKYSNDYPEIIDAILSVQKEPNAIWEDERVSSKSFLSYICFEYSNYIRGIIQNSSFLAGINIGQADLSKKEVHNAFRNLNSLLSIAPESIPVKFGEKNFAALKEKSEKSSGKPTIEILDPDRIWNKEVSFNGFVSSAKKIFDIIVSSYLPPEIKTIPIVRHTNEQLKLFNK